jgi:hypothetical protein
MGRSNNLQFEKGDSSDAMFANRTVGGRAVPCVVFYIVAVLAIVLYGHLLRITKSRDPLAARLFHHPVLQDVDGWSVSHLLFFGLLGVMFPDRHLQFLLVGIGWEVVETALGQNRFEVSGRRVQLIGEQAADGRATGAADAYWYGKESDIVMDAIGYAVGSALGARFWPPATAPPRAVPRVPPRAAPRAAPRALPRALPSAPPRAGAM